MATEGHATLRMYTKNPFPMAKRWLIFLLVLLLVPVASIVLVLRSESMVLDGLEWAVDNLTDFDLELVNPRIDVYAGSASADEVHLHQDTAYGPAMVSVLALDGRNIRWRDLLLGTLRGASLSADSVLIYIFRRITKGIYESENDSAVEETLRGLARRGSEKLPRGSVLEQPAVMQEQDVVSEAARLADIVRHQHDLDTAFA